VDCKSKSDVGSNKGNWLNIKIIQKVPEQHTGKARKQGTEENSYVLHCTQALEGTHVKVQNIHNEK
jgi:hypothetical protein